MQKIVLTPEALKTIKSFAGINPGMVFKPEHKFEVACPLKSVIGFYDVGVVVPIRFAIADVSKFLGVLSLHDKDTVEVTLVDNKVAKIKSKKGQTTYRLTDDTNVTHIPDNFSLPLKEVGTFSLKSTALEEIKTVANSLGLPHIIFGNDPTNHLTMFVKNIKDDSTDQHDIQSDAEATGEFDQVVKTEHLAKLVVTDYEVKVSTKFLYLQSVDKKIEYYVAVEPKNVA